MDKKENNENYQANILIGNFKTPMGGSFDNRKIVSNKTNPIYKKMFKYIHSNLSNTKLGKSLNCFNPKDLF